MIFEKGDMVVDKTAKISVVYEFEGYICSDFMFSDCWLKDNITRGFIPYYSKRLWYAYGRHVLTETYYVV